ncbi:hypothetical protein SAMN05660359_04064 [Geodermatophilus obscurus]|uniref:Uncharacterized protein n=2 Tax=Geodermatophilus obscurus TaxID=1861 RepID=A0A1I5HWT0_9ACTN|nr:hypothetical protein SAMN05660359_04064 [Geodermatophilus obscurus]
MRTSMRTASVMLLSAGALALGAGVAAAEEPGAGAAAGASAGQGFEPGPDYANFEPGPDYENFEPGAAPGTADLVDDNAARLLGSVVRGLFG